MKANQNIRNAARKSGVYLWQIAEAFGMQGFNFSRKLRHELPEEEQQRIFEIIRSIAKENNNDRS